MLSEERINELANTLRVKDGDIHGVTAFARAIEAECEKVPEGYALISIAQLKTWGHYEALDAMCQYPLAAAPKPAQASPIDLMECLQDRPVEPSKAKLPKGCHRSHPHEDMNEECQRKTVEAMVANLAAQADKQEPVVRLHITQTGSYPDVQVEVLNGEGFSENGSILLYTRPQPDLTAEVEFMQGKYEEMLAEWLPQKQRIAELEAQDTEMCDVHAQLLVEHGKAKLHIAALEEAAREARDALQYKLHVVEAIAKLDAVLGNAELTERRVEADQNNPGA